MEVYEWVLSGTLAGQFVQTVQHVSLDNPAPIPAFQAALDLADAMIGVGGVLESMMDCLPADYAVTSIRVKRVLPSGGPTAIRLAAEFSAPVGTRSGEISSAQVNPLMIWIPTTTPSKTGRLFFPGVSEDDIDEMMLSSTLVAAMNIFAAAYADDWSVGAMTAHGCVLRRSTGAPPHVPVSGDEIFAGQVSPLIGTQRRRLHPI